MAGFQRPWISARRVAHAAAATATVRPFGTLEDLLRPAVWDRLSETERARLLEPYQELIESLAAASGGSPNPSDPRIQAWVADFLAVWLQRAAAAAIQAWLDRAPADAHLVVEGIEGWGKTSLVATLARRAMARRPAPPDYCYVPDPKASGRHMLLTLPAGRAVPFVDRLNAVLQRIAQDWPGSNGTPPANDQSPPASALAALAAFAAAAPAPAAREYLERLHREFQTLLDLKMPYPLLFNGTEAPAGRTPVGGTTGAELGAPVIVTARGFRDITAALLHANGGVLVLTADDLLDRDQPSSVWTTLRAYLRAGEIPPHDAAGPAIPLAVRVIVIGPLDRHRELSKRAEDFERFFRHKVTLEDDVPWPEGDDRARHAEAAYAALAAGVARLYSLPPLDPDGVARLVEEGARRAHEDNRGHLTAEVAVLRDLVVECGHQALAATPPLIAPLPLAGAPPPERQATGADVDAVLAARRRQQGYLARLIREAILAGREIVPTEGMAIGQVNGLSIYSFSPLEACFGAPFRVSATVSASRDPGRQRLVDVAREAKIGDSSYISGSLTMDGYFDWQYGGRRLVYVMARLHFEQEHHFIEGDSAAAASLFAILSALAEVPVLRALAVTAPSACMVRSSPSAT